MKKNTLLYFEKYAIHLLYKMPSSRRPKKVTFTYFVFYKATIAFALKLLVPELHKNAG